MPETVLIFSIGIVSFNCHNDSVGFYYDNYLYYINDKTENQGVHDLTKYLECVC